jgi:hypothetical protein
MLKVRTLHKTGFVRFPLRDRAAVSHLTLRVGFTPYVAALVNEMADREGVSLSAAIESCVVRGLEAAGVGGPVYVSSAKGG